MAPIGWTPEGTATWQTANAALREYLEGKQNPPCPWCHGQGGFLRSSQELRSYVLVRCDGCFGTGEWVSGDAES